MIKPEHRLALKFGLSTAATAFLMPMALSAWYQTYKASGELRQSALQTANLFKIIRNQPTVVEARATAKHARQRQFALLAGGLAGTLGSFAFNSAAVHGLLINYRLYKLIGSTLGFE